MAQLAISAGRSLAHFAGRAALGIARQGVSTLIAGALQPDQVSGPALTELPVQTSTDGAPMMRVWGRARLAGQVIWASRFMEHREESGGGKGGPRQIERRYTVSFAVGLCEGQIAGVGRIWANGVVLDVTGIEMRIYPGNVDQAVDPLIAAIEGADAPAFLDTAYLVFEDFPLDAFGYRIPNLSVEVFRPGDTEGALEQRIRGVNLIPGSGEFAYHPEEVLRQLGPGREASENRHTARAGTDFLAALDALERDLPACRSVQIILAWFGDDLRCGACRIRPGVENREKLTEPIVWRVAGQTRTSAYLVNQVDGRPVYGGSPDDESILRAIGELKARGFSVTLYPFILMDIAAGNQRPDPWGEAEQAAFPWRGRMTCHPAKGQAGSVNFSAAARTQIDAFFGDARADQFAVTGESIAFNGTPDWRYNHFILHCAALARAAGGVDGFLIGSEMVSLTCVQDEVGEHPAVTRLIGLLEDCRGLLGPATRLSYAADWSEYSGHQDGQGSKYFHLDALWAHPACDAVAIDWYVPAADWRDAPAQLDEGLATSPHDRDYLRAGLTGGEFFDWYYASPADRMAQHRTAITDDQGEAWIWRRKDLVSWWSNLHHDRPDGVRASAPTAWQPASKPVWLTEIGCPAVDKGANQPNVFFDPKSAESALPWHSTGARDDLIQRRYLEAMLAHWSDPASNPVSPVYGAPMIETALIHVWAWDARPWPEFPVYDAVWSDGANWRLGHWLNGRAGLVPLAGILEEVAAACEVGPIDTTGLDELVSGYSFAGPQSGREILQPLARTFGTLIAEQSGGLTAASPTVRPADFTLRDPDKSLPEMRLAAAGAQVEALHLHHVDDSADYAPGLARAGAVTSLKQARRSSAPLLADPDLAAQWASGMLAREQARHVQLSLTLPPSALAIEAGDVLAQDGATWLVAGLDGRESRTSVLMPQPPAGMMRVGALPGHLDQPPPSPPRPHFLVLDLPEPVSAEETSAALHLAVFSAPWPGSVRVSRLDADDRRQALAEIETPARTGRLTSALVAGPLGYWDEASIIALELDGGMLESRSHRAVLDGANRLAVRRADGAWEIIAFRDAELLGARQYALQGLLRGLRGTPCDAAIPAGADLVLLDDAVVRIPIDPVRVGSPLVLEACASASSNTRCSRVELTPVDVAHRAYAPVHVVIDGDGAKIEASWIRRSRIGGDDWQAAEIPLGEASEAYRVEFVHEDSVIAAWELDEPAGFVWRHNLRARVPAEVSQLEMRISQLSERAGAGLAHRVIIDL